VKALRIGRRRGRDSEAALSPLELALRPALVDGRWQIPDHFNFTRDVVETLGRDPKRRALTSLGREGVIEHSSFLEICGGAALWATTLREANVNPGDRVIVVSGTTVDWLEIVLGTLKMGAVVVPCLPDVSSSQLERLVSSTDAALMVAEDSLETTVGRMGFNPDVHYFEVGAPRSSKEIPVAATHDTASRDLAFIVSTPGVGGTPKDVAHTHGSVFATRVQAEHWLDVGRGDAVWCTADAASPLTMWNTVVGPWSRGAEVVLHEGSFDIDERLDLLFRLGPSIICQSPAEYRALAEHRKLERFRSPRLRRLVSTGDFLDPEVVAVFEERWGMSIADGYAQAETNVIVGNLADGPAHAGKMGRALPGHHVAIIDDQGNELPAGIEGDLAVRGRPPTLFAGYWELPEETKNAFLGDWYLTGDVAQMDEDGVFTFVGRAEDVITSSGRTFGPFDVERVLAGHASIAAAAVVGIRDLQRGGQFVRAFVVPRPGADGSEQLEAELRQYAAETLPTQQVPREIVFVDELPTTSWKVNRFELRERPLAGRPLWDLPPTSEPAMEAAPLPPPIDSEFAPRVDRAESPASVPETPLEPVAFSEPQWEPVAFVEPAVVEPPPTVVEPESLVPDPAMPEPALRPPEPVVEAAVPLPETTPDPVLEPEPVEVAPVAEAVPALEPEPEPEPVVEPIEAEPVAEAVEIVEHEPDPIVVYEPVLETVEPVVAEPVAEVAPLVVPAPEPGPDAEPIAEAFQPAPVAEAVEPEPEPTPEVEPEDSEPPSLVVLPDLEPEPAPEHTPEFGAAAEAATPLPEYVIAEPEGPPPIALPEPEPEPELGPLPDFVLEPGPSAAAAPAPPAQAALEAEEEEDLGPLPDFVIDPDLPPELRPEPPPKPVPVTPPPPTALQVPTSERPEPTMSNASPPARGRSEQVQALERACRAGRRGGRGGLDGRPVQPAERVQPGRRGRGTRGRARRERHLARHPRGLGRIPIACSA
jgi:acyl-coenzyme A synthetase/AMP-(fatty) acid ligase